MKLARAKRHREPQANSFLTRDMTRRRIDIFLERAQQVRGFWFHRVILEKELARRKLS